jgi:hypothetical protein
MLQKLANSEFANSIKPSGFLSRVSISPKAHGESDFDGELTLALQEEMNVLLPLV